MPLYVYECGKCGKVLPGFRPMSRRDLLPRCGCGAKMRRVPAVPGKPVVHGGVYVAQDRWARGEKRREQQ